MKKLKCSGYYVPLDLLLDTRMGTLSRMNQVLAAAMNLKTYRNRMNDKFEGYTMEQFREAYAKRDKETLKYSLPTAFMNLLRQEVQRGSMANGKEFSPDMPKVYVNIWPYELDDVEIVELGTILVNLIRTEGIEIEIINMSLEELTPQYCRENFVFMSMYLEYNAWFDYHAQHKNLDNSVIKHILMMVPGMFDKEIPSDADVKRTYLEVGVDPLSMIEIEAKEFVDLVMIDSKHFSIMEFGGIKPTSPDVGPIQPKP